MRRIKEHFGDVPVHNITRAHCMEFKNVLTAKWQKKAWAKAEHLMPIIVLALATAMRKDEILGLTWDQVDLKRRMTTLTGADTKNKRVKYVPINADSEEVLRDRLKSRPKDGIYVFPGREGKRMHDFKTAWRCAKERAGIPIRCRFHDLKHTSVSRMVMGGVDPVTIGRMAGWTDSSAPVMLRRYAHLTGDHLQQAAKTLERGHRSHYTGTKTEISATQKGIEDDLTARNKTTRARSSAG